MIKKILGGAFLSAALMSQGANAEHFDVDLGVSPSGQVEVLNLAPVDQRTGWKILEAEFGEGENPYATDDPGFLAEDGTFNDFEPIWYNAVGQLHYFNGHEWVTGSFTEEVLLYGLRGEETIFNSENVFSGDTYGLIDLADREGGVHTHLEFEVDNFFGTGAPREGAYMIAIRVYGDDHTASEPFYIAFNLGMDEEDFEAAIDQRAE